MLVFTMCLILFCTPCAFLPEMSGHVSEIILKYLVYISFSLFLMYLFLIACSELTSNIRFIPLNIRLNTLVKSHKVPFSQKNLIIKFFNKIFVMFLLYEDHASMMIFLEHTLLDMLCYDMIICFLRLSAFALRFGVRSLSYVVLTQIKIFSPCFGNNDLTALWIFSLLLMLSSDVHPNPGPQLDQKFSSGFLSFCNWNLNTLSKDDFYRISLLEAHNTIFNYDIISLCETSLSDEIKVPENAIPGYIYHPLNNPDGSKNGGVGIFYKDSLPLKIRSDLSFDECLVSELIFGRKKKFLYRLLQKPKT